MIDAKTVSNKKRSVSNSFKNIDLFSEPVQMRFDKGE